MSRKSIEGKCPNCDKEMLVIVGQFRDFTDWQMKYAVACEICGYQFNLDVRQYQDFMDRVKESKKKKPEEK